MRYTTVIDIRDYPTVYRCLSARVLYLHMVLAAGYHDDDLDKVSKSLRGLAWETGLSVAAVRHGLQVLQKAGLLEPAETGTWIVKKWIPAETPSKRQPKDKYPSSDIHANVPVDLVRITEADRKASKATADKIKKRFNLK